jgi:hypothetical protein
MLCWGWYAFAVDIDTTKTLQLVRLKRVPVRAALQVSLAAHNPLNTLLKSIYARWRNIAFPRRHPNLLPRLAFFSRIAGSRLPKQLPRSNSCSEGL